jgi:hypothetical protein
VSVFRKTFDAASDAESVTVVAVSALTTWRTSVAVSATVVAVSAFATCLASVAVSATVVAVRDLPIWFWRLALVVAVASSSC